MRVSGLPRSRSLCGGTERIADAQGQTGIPQPLGAINSSVGLKVPGARWAPKM